MSKVTLHVGGSFADTKKRVLEAVGKAKAGKRVEPETHFTVESWEVLASVLSPRRLELLRLVHREPQPSVMAIARALERDYKRVHEDTEALTAAGLLIRENGMIEAPYDAIATEVAL